jgi:filamentous hemagglutinin
VLKAMTTEDTVRSLATVMLTAGLTNGLMNAAGMTSDPALLSQAEDMTEAMNILAEELQRAAIRGVVSAGVDTAINGGDLGQNLAYQMQAAGVAVLGSQGARAIGTAFKDQKIDTATKYIAHAALGGTMDLAMGGDGKSGALGAVVGELIADTYVNAWIGKKISQTEDYKKLSGDELRKELDKLDGEIAELRRRGVDLARLGAGMAAALTGGDIDIAAQAGGNAAEHNALPAVLIILAACEAVDGGIKIYNAYKLAEAIQDQDEAGIEYYGTEILIDSAVDAAPLGAVFTKLGMTKVGGIIMGLGAKVGDQAAGVASKSGIKSGESSFAFGSKLQKQIPKRGWDTATIDDVIAKPHATSKATNKATGAEATAYFNKDGSYVVRDNITHEIIQVSNRNDPNWIPDPTIQNPYRP